MEWLTLEALSHAFNLEEGLRFPALKEPKWPCAGLLIPMRAKIQEYYGAKVRLAHVLFARR